jgi:hypothetical protein
MLIQESVMRQVRFNPWPSLLIPLAFVLPDGCATHGLRCDAHLTPINPPQPAAALDAVPGALPPEIEPSDGVAP